MPAIPPAPRSPGRQCPGRRADKQLRSSKCSPSSRLWCPHFPTGAAIHYNCHLTRSKNYTPSTPLKYATPVWAHGNRRGNSSDDCIYIAPCVLGSLNALHYYLKYHEQSWEAGGAQRGEAPAHPAGEPLELFSFHNLGCPGGFTAISLCWCATATYIRVCHRKSP